MLPSALENTPHVNHGRNTYDIHISLLDLRFPLFGALQFRRPGPRFGISRDQILPWNWPPKTPCWTTRHLKATKSAWETLRYSTRDKKLRTPQRSQQRNDCSIAGVFACAGIVLCNSWYRSRHSLVPKCFAMRPYRSQIQTQANVARGSCSKRSEQLGITSLR